MINEKVERRWSVSVSGNERGSPVDLIVVNSIDGDPKSAKVSIAGEPGRHEVIVPVVDLVDLLRRVAANTSGIPSELIEK
jgi:hypothetical protein